ncbi:MAG: hypothetical protein IPJ94_23545 [Chloroflexi bacterium]|nr:hypothetical protein [Chloroflexota bacterium]
MTAVPPTSHSTRRTLHGRSLIYPYAGLIGGVTAVSPTPHSTLRTHIGRFPFIHAPVCLAERRPFAPLPPIPLLDHKNKKPGAPDFLSKVVLHGM